MSRHTEGQGVQAIGGLLVLPGWNDDRRAQFLALDAQLSPWGWTSHRAALPDSTWPSAQRRTVSREDALQQALKDHYDLTMALAPQPVLRAVLGFSFGGYIAAFVAAARPTDLLVLRSPALYTDDDWDAPKEELDKRDLDRYRRQVHEPADNRALACCAQFEGDVLLIDSERDAVIPKPVIASYAGAFTAAKSVTRYTLKDADHPLSNPIWQRRYQQEVVGWMKACMERRRIAA